MPLNYLYSCTVYVLPKICHLLLLGMSSLLIQAYIFMDTTPGLIASIG